MSAHPADHHWMAASLALSQRGRGNTGANPSVGCVIVQSGKVIGRGWTQPGGRPHAEAVALAAAGAAARGATAYVTLEPCAHTSDRGPACADLLIAAGVGRVVIARRDPDPRTHGAGIARLEAAGIVVELTAYPDAADTPMAGFFFRQQYGRAYVTLKLATSLDGCIALADGSSRWITGDAARRHTHVLRARSDAILVGRGTWATDRPSLDVRLSGLEGRSPRRLVLSSSAADGIETVLSVDHAVRLDGVNDLLVEGGAETAAAFIRAKHVDRLVLYRAPILIGDGKASLADIGLTDLSMAHGQWRLADARALGSDRLEVYVPARED